MDENRIDFRAFKWATENGNRCKNLCFRLKQHFVKFNIQNLLFKEHRKDYVKQKLKQLI